MLIVYNNVYAPKFNLGALILRKYVKLNAATCRFLSFYFYSFIGDSSRLLYQRQHKYTHDKHKIT